MEHSQHRALPSRQMERRTDPDKHQFSSIVSAKSWGTHRAPDLGWESSAFQTESLHAEAGIARPRLCSLSSWRPPWGVISSQVEGLRSPSARHSPAAPEHLPCARPCPWGWGFSGEQNIVLTRGLCGTLRMAGAPCKFGTGFFFFFF